MTGSRGLKMVAIIVSSYLHPLLYSLHLAQSSHQGQCRGVVFRAILPKGKSDPVTQGLKILTISCLPFDKPNHLREHFRTSESDGCSALHTQPLVTSALHHHSYVLALQTVFSFTAEALEMLLLSGI